MVTLGWIMVFAGGMIAGFVLNSWSREKARQIRWGAYTAKLVRDVEREMPPPSDGGEPMI